MMRGKYQRPSPTKLYQVTDYALAKINTPQMRRVLMDALGVTEFTIARYIQNKSINLLQKPALDAIVEHLHLREDEIYTVTEI